MKEVTKIVPLVKLSAANRRVWFMSSDGVTIDKIKDNVEVYNIGRTPTTDVVSLNDTDISISLENNKIYNLKSNAITQITLSASEGFSMCSIRFKAGETAPNFEVPATWRATGTHCSGGKFTPVANTEYNIGIDCLDGVTTLYVIKLDFT